MVAPDPDNTGLIGKTLSHYRVVSFLGQGGMGLVYEAEDQSLQRRVALKFLPDDLAESADARRRLRREAATLAVLNHPNICTVYELSEAEGRSFIAMERLDGVSLKLHLARRTLGTPEIIEISRQVASALQAAHDKDVIHRDIKPGNIFLANGQVKVLDFGLARRLAQAGDILSVGSSIQGRPIGTANYMAPERILQMPPDPRADLFSLGVVMFEMITGRLPFAGASPAQTITNILENSPLDLMQAAPACPAHMARIVRTLLSKRADDRYASASSLMNDLRTIPAVPLMGRVRSYFTRKHRGQI